MSTFVLNMNKQLTYINSKTKKLYYYIVGKINDISDIVDVEYQDYFQPSGARKWMVLMTIGLEILYNITFILLFPPILAYIVITFNVVMSLMFVYTMFIKMGESSNMLIFICSHVIFFMFVSFKIIIKFLPYRGSDKLKRRNYQIKKLKRKIRIKKMKFWEK